MLEIEWKSSHYHSDGRRRSRPKASTVHGWLVKWRATFSGNERLRKEGMHEMREAKAVREQERQQKPLTKAGASKSPFGLWPISFRVGRQSRTPKVAQRPFSKRPGHRSTRRLTFPNYPTKPPTNGQRLIHSCSRTGNRNPRGSLRKASNDSRGSSVRAAERKR